MDYRKAKTLLNQADQDRLLCVFLNSTPSNVSWDTAAEQFGSASTNSFRTMYSSAMKKLKDAAASYDHGSNGDLPSCDNASKSQQSKSRKRKSNATDAPPAKRTGRKKSVKTDALPKDTTLDCEERSFSTGDHEVDPVKEETIDSY